MKVSCDVVDFLQVVICILLESIAATKMCYIGLALSGIACQPIILSCFKLKKLKKDMRYQAEFLLPLKLEEILCYFVL